jgi:hypothetical protein
MMPTRAFVVLAVAMLVAAGCSSSDDDDDDGDDQGEEGAAVTTTTATTESSAPEGPLADLSTELTGGGGVNVAAASPPEPILEAAGYEQHEFAAAGTATAYAPEGELGADGRWSVRPDREAAYRTRIVVRRPADPADASGTVVVEWLNVSGGLDADPDWQMLREDITRNGDAWVGVSAQVLGINGGPVRVSTPESEASGAGRGLRAIDPDRYGSLDHPGDDFAYDIFTQVARALRSGGDVLGGPTPDVVLAAGESQSAFALVTYVNAVHPLAGVFDGFLVHSRGTAGLPLVNADGPADIASSLGGQGTILRTDTAEPILELQSETDVTGILASANVRQDDTDAFRLWEMAGTAHADTRLVGERADSLGCGAINDGPMHLIAKAAYRGLVTWVRDGEPPAEAPRLELVAGASSPSLARDADGIVLGGIRTPLVDVPVDVLSGEPGPSGAVVCLLSGHTTPLPAASLASRYADRAAYEDRYAEAADAVIDAGFVLEDDRDALLDRAEPDRIG